MCELYSLSQREYYITGDCICQAFFEKYFLFLSLFDNFIIALTNRFFCAIIPFDKNDILEGFYEYKNKGARSLRSWYCHLCWRRGNFGSLGASHSRWTPRRIHHRALYGNHHQQFFHPAWIKPALKFVSKKILKVAIILLGASLSVGTIMSVGKMTFFVMIFTFLMCFGGGYFVRKIFKLNWKLGNLISAGTGICGFWALAIINSLGWIPVSVSGVMKTTSKFLMVSALAAIGLGTSITDFKKAGLAPMFYGVTIDTLVTLTALGVIWLMGLM